MIKVFLVEDEFIIRKSIRENINWEKEGFQFCGEAGDGEIALPLIRREKPDILITDVKMPFMDGLELSALVKKELPATKILILSGFRDFDFAKKAISIGVTDYLSKPITSERLLEAIKQIPKRIEDEREDVALLKIYQKEMEGKYILERNLFLNHLRERRETVIIALLILVAIYFFMLKSNKFGRRIYAIGGSEQSAFVDEAERSSHMPEPLFGFC